MGRFAKPPVPSTPNQPPLTEHPKPSIPCQTPKFWPSSTRHPKPTTLHWALQTRHHTPPTHTTHPYQSMQAPHSGHPDSKHPTVMPGTLFWAPCRSHLTLDTHCWASCGGHWALDTPPCAMSPMPGALYCTLGTLCHAALALHTLSLSPWFLSPHISSPKPCPAVMGNTAVPRAPPYHAPYAVHSSVPPCPRVLVIPRLPPPRLCAVVMGSTAVPRAPPVTWSTPPAPLWGALHPWQHCPKVRPPPQGATTPCPVPGRGHKP